MIGPYPQGHWMEPDMVESRGMLVPGHRYRVTKPFADYDKDQHPSGETWTYLGYNFLPYEDGLSLFVSLDGQQEWHIRMQLIPEEQSPIIDNLQDYVVDISSEPAQI